jgi:outer membrane protein OmpA-like peptidoglycan-associated protein
MVGLIVGALALVGWAGSQLLGDGSEGDAGSDRVEAAGAAGEVSADAIDAGADVDGNEAAANGSGAAGAEDGASTDGGAGGDADDGDQVGSVALGDEAGGDRAPIVVDAIEDRPPPTVTVQPPPITDFETDLEGPPGGKPWAVYKDNRIHLLGQVPDQATSNEIATKAGAVVGPQNVVNLFEVVPGIDFDRGGDAPIYVEDTVLFDVGSAEIDPAYYELIDLGVFLLAINPQATITVVTRTDSVGSAEANMELSRRRAQAIFDYYLSKGGNPAQGILDPRGEEGASDDDDPATRARQRSAEFILSGFLADPSQSPGA